MRKAAVSAVIMASGNSTRMQQNKLFLTCEDQTFLERTIELVRSVGFGRAILVIKPEDLANIKVPRSFIVIENNASERGQSASVRFGTAQVQGEGVLFLTADQPLLTRELLMAIIRNGENNNIVFPTRGKKPSTPIYFGSAFFDELLRVNGDSGGRSVRDEHPEAWVTLPQGEDLLMDVDTPEDYRTLQQLTTKGNDLVEVDCELDLEFE